MDAVFLPLVACDDGDNVAAVEPGFGLRTNEVDVVLFLHMEARCAIGNRLQIQSNFSVKHGACNQTCAVRIIFVFACFSDDICVTKRW